MRRDKTIIVISQWDCRSDEQPSFSDLSVFSIIRVPFSHVFTWLLTGCCPERWHDVMIHVMSSCYQQGCGKRTSSEWGDLGKCPPRHNKVTVWKRCGRWHDFHHRCWFLLTSNYQLQIIGIWGWVHCFHSWLIPFDVKSESRWAWFFLITSIMTSEEFINRFLGNNLSVPCIMNIVFPFLNIWFHF